LPSVSELLKHPLHVQTLSERVNFSISPKSVALPNGVVEAIRVQDIERNLWFEYNRGTGWSAQPEVTVGAGKLYIAAYYVNAGGAGMLHASIYDAETATMVFYKEEYIESGAGFGLETGTIDMPNKVYTIVVDVAP
jgi:hypothetical protein